MKNKEFKKSKIITLVNCIDYEDHSVVIKTIFRKVGREYTFICF